MHKLLGFAWRRCWCPRFASPRCPPGDDHPGTLPEPAVTTGTTFRASQVLDLAADLQGTNNFGKVEDLILSSDGPTYLLVSNGGRHVMMPLKPPRLTRARRPSRTPSPPRPSSP